MTKPIKNFTNIQALVNHAFSEVNNVRSIKARVAGFTRLHERFSDMVNKHDEQLDRLNKARIAARPTHSEDIGMIESMDIYEETLEYKRYSQAMKNNQSKIAYLRFAANIAGAMSQKP